MIQLDPQVLTLLVFIAKAALGVMGVVIKHLKNEVKDAHEKNHAIQNELMAYKVEVANNYATKDFMTDNFKTINAKLDRLFEEVHKKQG